MSDTINTPDTTDTTDSTEEAPIMTTLESIPTTAEATISGSLVRWENPNGTSNRVVVYAHDGDWDRTRDFSVSGLEETRAALSAMAKWAAGGVTGSEKILLTAPTEKLAFANGTGRFGFVRHDFIPGVDDITVDVDGEQMVLTIEPHFLPKVGYRRIDLDAGSIYCKGYAEFLTPGGKINPLTGELKVEYYQGRPQVSSFEYWYAKTLSALMAGDVSISASVGPKTHHLASRVFEVFTAEDPATANETRLWASRESGRIASEVKETAQVLKTEGVTTAATSDLDVELFGTNGTVNLRTFAKGSFIHNCNEVGTKFRPIPVVDDSDAGLLAIATVLRSRGALVILS